MIKILIKAAILVCIVLSIYFIVNPSACSNLINGRVVNSMDKVPTLAPNESQHRELLTPVGDKPQVHPVQAAQEQSQAQEPAQQAPAVTDTRSTQPVPAADESTAPAPQAQAAPAYTQADMDYAVAKRYVELENEYIRQNKDMKQAAKEISYIVMDDFELTPTQWEAFLQRATASNLFEKVRQEAAAQQQTANQ